MQTQIQEYRKRLGVTQEDLAKTVGVSRQTIISLEAGKYNPSLRLAYDIKCALKAGKIEDIFNFK